MLIVHHLLYIFCKVKDEVLVIFNTTFMMNVLISLRVLLRTLLLVSAVIQFYSGTHKNDNFCSRSINYPLHMLFCFVAFQHTNECSICWQRAAPGPNLSQIRKVLILKRSSVCIAIEFGRCRNLFCYFGQSKSFVNFLWFQSLFYFDNTTFEMQKWQVWLW